ncbi:MAG: hypothetical protein J6U72_06170 [Clostridia bacterium]|nr:hypothetical protein [Clostridia bacterium]
MKNTVKRLWTYLEGWKGLVFSLCAFIPLAASAFAAENSVLFFARWFFLIVLACLAICPWILRRLRRLDAGRLVPPSGSRREKLRCGAAFFLAAFALFFIKYIIYYPAAFSPDSFDQYSQAVAGSYNDWNPVIHTLIAFKLPLALTGGWTGSIILFQITAFSLVIAYIALTLRTYAGTKYALFAFAFIMLNPQTTNMALYPWKDVTFAMGAVMLGVFALKICFTRGDWLRKPLNIIMLGLLLGITSLVRHNAVLFTLPMLLVVLLFAGFKRTAAAALCFVVTVFAVKVPLYSCFDVTSPDRRQVEMLGLPMTVIGAAVTYSPERLDGETLDFAYAVAPKEVWEQRFADSDVSVSYLPKNLDVGQLIPAYGDFDNVKWNRLTNLDVIEEYGPFKVIKIALNCIKRAPIASLKGLIKLTEPVYTLSGDHIYMAVPRLNSNSYGVTPGGVPALQKLNILASAGLNLMFPHLFLYTGAMHLALIGLALARLDFRRKGALKRLCVLLPVFCHNFGTMLLLTTAGDSSRFFYCTFPLMPVLALMLLKDADKSDVPGA